MHSDFKAGFLIRAYYQSLRKEKHVCWYGGKRDSEVVLILSLDSLLAIILSPFCYYRTRVIQCLKAAVSEQKFSYTQTHVGVLLKYIFSTVPP